MTKEPGGRRWSALFLGTPGPLAARVLWGWLEAGHTVAEVWTSARHTRGTWKRDRRLGRFAPHWSLSATLSRFDLAARAVESPARWPGAVAALEASAADVVLSVAFPHILPAAFLAACAGRAINFHPAVLPRYRGPSPLVGMLLDEAQDQCGGVTAHLMVPAIDAGPILATRSVPLPHDRNVRRWELELARAAAALAIDAVPRYLAGTLAPESQDENEASYRRPSRRELALDATATGMRVAWLCATVGTLSPIAVATEQGPVAVTGLRRRLGPPTGAAPRVALGSVELDLADGRARLARRMSWDGRRIRLGTFLLRARTGP